MPADSIIPEIPGVRIDQRFEYALRERINRTVGQTGNRYFVAEKSDGIRLLLYCVLNEKGLQQVFLVGEYFMIVFMKITIANYVPQLRFPLWSSPNALHNDTIVDGELIVDREPDGQLTTRYLAFDLLAVHGQNLTQKPFGSRLARLQNDFINPYKRMLQSANPEFVRAQPFKLSVKEMQRSYGLTKMFNEIVPQLKHGSDGLIFTSAVAPYITSTNDKMLKWKPPSENSVDFKLALEFPMNPHQPGTFDYTAKPRFLLRQWEGGSNYSPFGEMVVSDHQWEQWRAANERLQDRIVEVVFTPEVQGWTYFRFRDDKDHGNHSSVVQKVIQSIRDGVEKDELLKEESKIRDAWKQREAMAKLQQHR
ncbi:Dcp1p-Dcp2p decapping enzyme complex alpha subunit [Actinomortierella wolfii]|nr:Dcp1p-Dcp2p decapping enzyme complex alpha subunit [Actinomortierella wolfii]